MIFLALMYKYRGKAPWSGHDTGKEKLEWQKYIVSKDGYSKNDYL